MKCINLLRPIMDFRSVRAAADTVVIEGVTGYHQWNSYSCGKVAIYTVLRAAGFPPIVWAELPEACKTTGMTESVLVSGLRNHGIRTRVMPRVWNVLVSAILRGDMVITTTPMPTQRPGDTHWVVVAGIGDKRVLALNCTGLPAMSSRWIPWDDTDGRLLVCSTGFGGAVEGGRR